MKALLSKAPGGPDTLVLENVAEPAAGPGQLLVRVAAVGVNFPDSLIISDRYQFRPERPFAPGGEFSGTVEAVGEGVTDFAPGDRVLAMTIWGAMSEKVVVDVWRCARIPDDMPLDEAAAFLLTYGTSYHALVDRAGLKAGETLLVLGAAGGVGLAAVEIGKALGARVVAAASSDEKLAVCRAHGADELINYSSGDFREAIRAATGGRGPDVVYDPVGGPYSEPALRSIAWRGRHLVVGFAAGEIPKLPWNLMLLKGAAVVGVFWGEFVRREPQANLAAMQQMLGWMAEGKLRPLVSRRYALEDTAQALNDMAARRVTGKVVIVP
jgi:NADPH2:quinone reductase